MFFCEVRIKFYLLHEIRASLGWQNGSSLRYEDTLFQVTKKFCYVTAFKPGTMTAVLPETFSSKETREANVRIL